MPSRSRLGLRRRPPSVASVARQEPSDSPGDVVADPLIMETGRLVVPTTPGLGATLDAAAVTGWAVSAAR